MDFIVNERTDEMFFEGQIFNQEALEKYIKINFDKTLEDAVHQVLRELTTNIEKTVNNKVEEFMSTAYDENNLYNTLVKQLLDKPEFTELLTNIIKTELQKKE